MKNSLSRLFIFLAVLAIVSSTIIAADAPAVPAVTEQPSLAKKKFNRGPWENEIGYTQAVRVGNTLYVSGITGGGAMPAAIKKSYDNVAKTLAAHGLGFQHVVKETIYTTDIEALKANANVRKSYYGTDFPAATWVQVARLFQPEHVIEVEVIAIFPDAAR
ncbi:MAG: RidA family protein [Nibricoccus sp.]